VGQEQDYLTSGNMHMRDPEGKPESHIRKTGPNKGKQTSEKRKKMVMALGLQPYRYATCYV